MKTIIRTQKGFSLIELMVVVAIIGILAAIAIPNFQGFQRKARQSEAKAILGAIYASEKAYFAEHGDYSSYLAYIGVAPDGQILYDSGFNEGQNQCAAADTGCAGLAVAITNITHTSEICGTPWGQDCATVAGGGIAGSIGTGTAAGAVMAAGDFEAVARGWIGGQVEDRWRITRAKVLTNEQPGY